MSFVRILTRLLNEKGASIQRRPLFISVCISVFIFYIINFSHTYRHISIGQGVYKKITMEALFDFIMSLKYFGCQHLVCKKLPLVQEDVIKHEKYSVVMASHSTAMTMAHSMAFFSLKLMSNDLHDVILDWCVRKTTPQYPRPQFDTRPLLILLSNVPPGFCLKEVCI